MGCSVSYKLRNAAFSEYLLIESYFFFDTGDIDSTTASLFLSPSCVFWRADVELDAFDIADEICTPAGKTAGD